MCGENRGGGWRCWWWGWLFFSCFTVSSRHGRKKNKTLLAKVVRSTFRSQNPARSWRLALFSLVTFKRSEKALRHEPGPPLRAFRVRIEGKESTSRPDVDRATSGRIQDSRAFQLESCVDFGYDPIVLTSKGFFFFFIRNYWKPSISPTTADYFTPVKF